MFEQILEMFKNKHGKLSLSKVIPAMWFLYLLYALAFVFKDKDIPNAYFQLTMVFSSVYVGRTAVDKIKDPTKSTTTQ